MLFNFENRSTDAYKYTHTCVLGAAPLLLQFNHVDAEYFHHTTTQRRD